MSRRFFFNTSFSFVSAIIAGSIGSVVNLLAIRMVALIVKHPGTGGLAHILWRWGQALLRPYAIALPPLSPFIKIVFHIFVGTSMAIIYGALFYDRLCGPKWLRGLLFAQIPWLIQVFFVLPYTGAGILGFRLSPLVPLTTFALNALYGIILGAFYTPRCCKNGSKSTTFTNTESSA